MLHLGIIYTWVSVDWMWNLNGNLHSESMKTEVIFLHVQYNKEELSAEDL